MKWRVIQSEAADGFTNMAVDEAVLLSHSRQESPPTLRFYGWRPAAVSLGYFQRIDSELDVKECENRGISIVRRLTGGRAVLHDAELTYSVVVREDVPFIPPTVTGSYRYFCAGLLEGLKQLGVAAEMTMPKSAYGQRGKEHASAACFDASSHYEIAYQGRKLVGSAQVRKYGVILQHGSILIRFSPETVAGILKVPSPEKRSKIADMLASKATCLEEILGRSVSWQEVYQVMPEAFAHTLGLDLEPDKLTEQEQALARQLAADKYSQDAWNKLR